MIEIKNNDFTPYAVATLINEILSENGIDRQIPPQMMYNYTRNGLIAKRTKNNTSTKNTRYSAEEVVAFVNKWFAKNYKLDAVARVHKVVDPFEIFTGDDEELIEA